MNRTPARSCGPRAATYTPRAVAGVSLLLLATGLGCRDDSDVIARAPELLPLTGALTAHDPSVVAANQGFLLFATGPGIALKHSDDLLEWRDVGRVFPQNPAWIAERVPEAIDLWSPDISFFGGRHHLYYAVSTFGSDRSCIGHATASELGQDFADRGPLLCSNVDGQIDDWNAIDPDVVFDSGAEPWLVFGSYGSGIKLVRLDANGARADDRMTSLAARPEGIAVQAANAVRRGSEFFLFASFDACCAGADSTRKLMVGRASAVAGPYLDRDGTPMLDGGGTLLLEGDARFRGPGSNDTLSVAGATYNVYHVYDADTDGRPTLRIAELLWDAEGWPVSAGP